MNKVGLSLFQHLIFIIVIFLQNNCTFAEDFCNICGREIIGNHFHNECDTFRRTLQEKLPQLSEKGCVCLMRKLLHKIACLGFIPDKSVVINGNVEISDELGTAAGKLWDSIDRRIYNCAGANTVLRYFRSRLNQKNPS